MDPRMQYHAVTAYQRWFPESSSILFQTPTHNHLLIDYLRDEVYKMNIVEIMASEGHRHFVVPLLDLRGKYETFGMPYKNVKHYFAAFRAPWDSNTAIFDGIGSLNGVNTRAVGTKLVYGVDMFRPEQFGLTFQVP